MTTCQTANLQKKKLIHICTSQEERVYGTIKGSTQATQAALSHTRAQCNPMVERGPPKWPKIKKLSKEQAADKHMSCDDAAASLLVNR